MSVMKRVSLIFKSKANKALDRMEDPRETLDYSYQRQLEMLQKVRRGVADVATSRKRLELQMNQINQQSGKLEKQAQGRARRRARGSGPGGAQPPPVGAEPATDLQAQYAQLQGEEEKLTLASQRLQTKVDTFRTRKETIKATYTAAEAQTRINEAFSGISEEMGDVGMAIQRAEDKTAQMQARAGAIDELLASGALDDASGHAARRHPGRAGPDGRGHLGRPASSSGSRASWARARRRSRSAAADGAGGRPSAAGRAGRRRAVQAEPVQEDDGHDRPHPGGGPAPSR